MQLLILLFVLTTAASAKTLGLKDLVVDTDISDIQKTTVRPTEVTVVKIDLGADPLNMAPQKAYDPVRTKRMLSPDELVKQQPTPESIGRYYPGY